MNFIQPTAKQIRCQVRFAQSYGNLTVFPPRDLGQRLGDCRQILIRPGQIDDTTFKAIVQETERMLSLWASINMARTTAIFLFLILMTSGSGCVTVKLGSEGGKRAEGVHFKEPAKPFVTDDERKEVDAAWKNPKNGNVISYISDCQDPTDPPLEQITSGVITGLSDLKILEEQTTVMQEREARRVHAAGKVDGVPTEIDLLAFKRNHCIYILSHVGVKKAFNEDRHAFAQFLDGFKAP